MGLGRTGGEFFHPNCKTIRWKWNRPLCSLILCHTTLIIWQPFHGRYIRARRLSRGLTNPQALQCLPANTPPLHVPNAANVHIRMSTNGRTFLGKEQGWTPSNKWRSSSGRGVAVGFPSETGYRGGFKASKDAIRDPSRASRSLTRQLSGLRYARLDTCPHPPLVSLLNVSSVSGPGTLRGTHT